MTEKYGFVYMWYNRRHKRFYVGSHWGFEDDGYICSSNWMRKSYYRNPQDFKRRILSRIYTNRKDLLLKEGEWLSLIKETELKTKYYNFRNKVYDEVWYASEEKRKTVSERISASAKKNYEDPEFKAKMDEALSKRDFSKASDPDVIERKRKKMKAHLEKKFPLENRIKRLPKNSPELNKIYSESASTYWKTVDPEKAKVHREKMRQSLIGKESKRKGETNSSDHNFKISQANKGRKYFININTGQTKAIKPDDIDKYLNDTSWTLKRK